MMLKTGKTLQGVTPSREIHEAILNQLYGVDNNPFPLHLTAMNMATRNARNPSSTMNIIMMISSQYYRNNKY